MAKEELAKAEAEVRESDDYADGDGDGLGTVVRGSQRGVGRNKYLNSSAGLSQHCLNNLIEPPLKTDSGSEIGGFAAFSIVEAWFWIDRFSTKV